MSLLNKITRNILYNFSSTPLDPDFLVVKNIWRRAEILKEFKSEVSLFAEIQLVMVKNQKMLQQDYYNNPFYNWTY